MVERVFNKQAFKHSVETPCVLLFCLFFFLFFSVFLFSFCPKSYLNVNFDDTVEKQNKKNNRKEKEKQGPDCSGQWKIILAQMDQN